MDQFVMGAIAMASWIAGLFFLRFWRDTRDRLFAMFALAFWIFGLSRLGLAMFTAPDEKGTFLYWVRFAAFLLIIVAIIDKNRPRNAAG
jgi:hypothetical protein